MCNPLSPCKFIHGAATATEFIHGAPTFKDVSFSVGKTFHNRLSSCYLIYFMNDSSLNKTTLAMLQQWRKLNFDQ